MDQINFEKSSKIAIEIDDLLPSIALDIKAQAELIKHVWDENQAISYIENLLDHDHSMLEKKITEHFVNSEGAEFARLFVPSVSKNLIIYCFKLNLRILIRKLYRI